MKVWIAVLAVVSLAGCVHRTPPPDLTQDVRAGHEVQLTLPQYGSGKPYSLAQDKGKVVLLDVWATWCEPCRDALPVYQDLQKQYGAKGFVVETINIDEDPHQIDAFLKETKISLPILLDPGGNFSQDVLHVTRMPTTFFIGRDGEIRSVREGFAEEFLAKYQSEIETLLAE
jgi:thiol-disulfide isomerase/thioredoxin